MPDRILVVDDEEAIRKIVCAVLAAAGYTCRQAGSGIEALALLNSGDVFELMLSDLMMRDLDGIGLLEQTKIKFPEMPVIMVTAVHDISVALAAIRNGAYDYLLKPFDRLRFRKALAWARTSIRRDQDETAASIPSELRGGRKPLERVTIKTTGRVFFLKTKDIDWVEAAGNYLRLHSGEATHLLRETMNNLESRLDPEHFCRIHRSTLVNIDRIRELQPLFHGDYVVILRDGTELTLSRTYRRNLPGFFGETR